LNQKDNTVEYARAGHTELLICVPSHKHKLRKFYTQGTALGLMPGDMVDEFDAITFTFFKDMSILLFTDGITEALNKKDEEFGIDKLRDNFMASCEGRSSPQETIEKVLRAVDMFVEETPQSDDQTLVVIKQREQFV
jgi:sigma-B regulation protein RsbU (phosphoserine phosphatase)